MIRITNEKNLVSFVFTSIYTLIKIRNIQTMLSSMRIVLCRVLNQNYQNNNSNNAVWTSKINNNLKVCKILQFLKTSFNNKLQSSIMLTI